MYHTTTITAASVDRMERRRCTGAYDRVGALAELTLAIYLDKRARHTVPKPLPHGRRVGTGVMVPRARQRILDVEDRETVSKIFGVGRRESITNGRQR